MRKIKANRKNPRKSDLSQDYVKLGFVYQGGRASSGDPSAPQVVPLFMQHYNLTASTLKWG